MYVLNYHEQVERINQMIPLRKNEKTFEVFYHDPQSGELWKSFFPYKKNGLELNGPKLLRPEPLPKDLEHQLELCLNSENVSDADGLAIEYSPELSKWEPIIECLEKNRKKYLRKNFIRFINQLGILNPEKNIVTVKKQCGLPKEVLKSLKRKAQIQKWKKLLGL